MSVDWHIISSSLPAESAFFVNVVRLSKHSGATGQSVFLPNEVPDQIAAVIKSAVAALNV